MTLRQAKVDDHWRRVASRPYLTRVSRFSFQNLSCLADASIEFSGGINAIIGSNGVGKSTLVAAIAELLGNGVELVLGHRQRLQGSRLSGTVFNEEVELQLGVRDGQNGERVATGVRFEGEFKWVDPSALANYCVSQVNTDQNFADLLESVTPIQLGDDQLALASYLVNRKYSSLNIYEISDYSDIALYGGFDRFPYFEASIGELVYGSEAMGRGELSLLLMYWTLLDAPKDSILIIEEPETHVSPLSQESFMNVLAKYSDEMGIWCLVSTHSPTILKKLGRQQITFLTRAGGASTTNKGPTHVQIATMLGGGVAYRGTVVVEDVGAKGFLTAILEKYAPDLLRQLEIIEASGAAKITDALRHMPKSRTMTLVGVYDGNERNHQFDVQWPIVFLPGDSDPEQLLKSLMSVSEHEAAIAAEFHRQPADISVALERVAGVDHHDAILEFSSALNIDVHVVRRGLVRVWLSVDANAQLAEKLVQELKQAINQLGHNL